MRIMFCNMHMAPSNPFVLHGGTWTASLDERASQPWHAVQRLTVGADRDDEEGNRGQAAAAEEGCSMPFTGVQFLQRGVLSCTVLARLTPAALDYCHHPGSRSSLPDGHDRHIVQLALGGVGHLAGLRARK